MGNNGNSDRLFSLGSKITVDGDCSHKIKSPLLLGRKAMAKLHNILNNKDTTLLTKVRVVKAMVFPVVMYRCYLANKGPSSQGYGFSSGHVWVWELDCEESWAPKNGWFWTVVLEKTLESPLDCKEIEPVHPETDQSWVFIGRTDAKAETPVFWPPHANSWLIGKYPDGGRDWGQEEKGMTGWDGWMASLIQWTWVLASSRSWWRPGKPGVLQSMGCKELDTTERQN